MPMSALVSRVRTRLLGSSAAGGFELELDRRSPPVDAERAGRILVQVLELAEALPFRATAKLDYPRLPDRLVRE